MDGQLESISNDVALVHGRDRERERERAVYVYSRTFSTTGRIVGCLAGERACWSPAQLCQGVVMHRSTAIRVAKHGSDTKDLCQIMKTKEHACTYMYL